jgi:alpha-glucosidase (family GH31 glycosyl hydrolase)
MKKSFELIHRPFGNHHPYESGADERSPRYPYPHDPVELGVLTRPIGAAQKVTASFWIAEHPDQVESSVFSFTKSIPAEVAFTEDGHLSEAAARSGLVVGVDRWRVSLPAFPAGAKVCYRLTAEIGDEHHTSQVYAYTVRKVISLDEVVDIFQGQDAFMFELQNLKEESRGYLYLNAVSEDHLQVEAGHGDCPELENSELVRFVTPPEVGFNQNIGNIRLQVDGGKFNLRIFNRDHLILQGMKAPQLVLGDDETVEAVVFSFDSPPDEGFYGFGERFNAINQRGQKLDVRVHEQYKNHGLRTYLPMPLFISSQGYGLMVQTLRYSLFDLAHNDPGRWTLHTELGEQKQMIIDILLGDRSQLLDIVTRLNTLTSLPALPPDWAFGLWISGNEWNTQARVDEIVKQNEKHEIPTSVIVLEAWSDENTFYIWNDAQYTAKLGEEPFHYTDFDFPPEGMWPDPKGLVADLHKKGVRVLLWQIPVLKVNEDNHTQLANDKEYMLENAFCVQEADGRPYHIRPFWFHDGLLMDFTHPQGVDWWMGKRTYLLTEIGIDGFKTDGGEHIWGRDLVFADGRKSDEIWNQYPNLYAGAYYQFARKYKSDAITFSRAGFTGAQAFPCHWAGDENSTWEAFQHSIFAGLNAGISGIAFWGWDFAGFSGEIPTAELYLRATAMATFCPIMQYHSEYNHHRQPFNDRTPWNIAERTQTPEVLSIFRFFARLRMNLLPYILHTARQSALTGLPMMRVLCLAYPQDEMASEYPIQYLFGDSLLVAPIVEPGLSEIEVYLPEGDWYSFWDGKFFQGGATYNLMTSLAKIPVFVRSNSLLPLNLNDTYALGCDVGNQTTAYERLCFMFYPATSGNYTWHDELAQAEIRFSWAEISPDKFMLRINALTRPIHILLPGGFNFDPVSSETASVDKNLALKDVTAQDIQVFISKIA